MAETTAKGRSHKKLYIFLGIILALVVLRLFLPQIVLRYVNKSLSEMKEYKGHVEDIDIALIRGAYVIKGMRILKVENQGNRSHTIPFFTTPEIDLSVQWNALFKGRVVGEIYVEDPTLNFVKGGHKGEDVKQDTADFLELVDDLMPLKVNRFEIHRGEIHYIDPTSDPKVDVAMTSVEVIATNLDNVQRSAEALPATLKAVGKAYEGRFNLNMKFNALAKNPTFDMNAEFKNLNLVKVNNFLQAYGNFDVKKGRFSTYVEFAAKNGQFGGYVKPVITDLDVVQWTKEEGSFTQILWETIVAAGASILTNHKTDQIVTKVPINGTFDDPKVDVWRAVSLVLRNAFVEALKPAVDESININKLKEDKKKGFFQRVFGKDDDKKDKSPKTKNKK